MNNKNINIIIKFAEIDDITFQQKGDGWIKVFTQLLKNAIALHTDQTVRIIHKSENEVIDLQEFEGADAVIYILSPAFIFSSNLKQEISNLEKELYFNIELLNTKIIKVLKGPVNEEDIPMTIALGSYYPFFKYTDSLSEEYETLISEEQNPNDRARFWDSLTDIVYDLLRLLKIPNTKDIIPEGKQSVFLSSKHKQNFWERLEIKRELKDFGIDVLPDSDYSVEVKYLDDPNAFYINKSKIAIHFPEEFIPFDADKLAKISANSEIERLIWFNPEMEMETETNRTYNELKRNLKNLDHVEAVETNIQELKIIIKEKMMKNTTTSNDTILKREKDTRYLYLITGHVEENKNIQRITDLIELQGVKVLFSYHIEDPSYRRKVHFEYLKEAEYCLVLFGEEPVEWLLANLKEIEKSAGFSRNTPLLNKGIITNQLDLPTELIHDKEDFILLNLDSTFDSNTINDFLNS